MQLGLENSVKQEKKQEQEKFAKVRLNFGVWYFFGRVGRSPDIKEIV